MPSTLLTGLALLGYTSAAYVWPSKQDSMEDLLYLQSGYIRNGALADQVMTCAFGANQPGIQKSAEWVRTNFHDAATHDSTAGTGGLDGSVQYELDRQENLGAALNNTLGDISSSVNVQSSAADVLALSLVIAVARCGQLYVPFRMGRKDAVEAGPMGVPEAHTDLETARKRFSIAGFNDTEMITLVACGHTIGGVHSVDHPEIVSGPVEAANVARFDTTTGEFDNKVVTEYLQNVTANPLVVNANNTLNSDKRIFASDNNGTMKRLADPAFFKSQCENLFERMIDLVPSSVTLTEPMQPADIRPYISTYFVKTSGEIEFAGRIRVRTTEGTNRNATDLDVTVLPSSRNSAQSIPDITTKMGTFRGGSSFGYFKEIFYWYEFNTTIPADVGFQSFNIKLTSKTTGEATTFDNAATGGYPVHPDILYQLTNTCVTYDSATDLGTATIVVAIRKSLLEGGAKPLIQLVQRKKQERNFIPKLEVETLEMEAAGKENGDFVYYKAVTTLPPTGLSTTFDIEVGDQKVEFQELPAAWIGCLPL